MEKINIYKSKILRKKAKGSSTPGLLKGDNCRASFLERYFAKYSRAYKHPEYNAWVEKTRI